MTLEFEALRSSAYRGERVDSAARKLLDVISAMRKGVNREILIEVWCELRASTRHRSAEVDAQLLRMADKAEARFMASLKRHRHGR